MPKAGISQAEYEARERFKKKKADEAAAATTVVTGGVIPKPEAPVVGTIAPETKPVQTPVTTSDAGPVGAPYRSGGAGTARTAATTASDATAAGTGVNVNPPVTTTDVTTTGGGTAGEVTSAAAGPGANVQTGATGSEPWKDASGKDTPIAYSTIEVLDFGYARDKTTGERIPGSGYALRLYVAPSFLDASLRAQWDSYDKQINDLVTGDQYKSNRQGSLEGQNRMKQEIAAIQDRQKMLLQTAIGPGNETNLATPGVTAGAGTPISESDQYKAMQAQKAAAEAGGSTAAQDAVAAAMGTSSGPVGEPYRPGGAGTARTTEGTGVDTAQTSDATAASTVVTGAGTPTVPATPTPTAATATAGAPVTTTPSEVPVADGGAAGGGTTAAVTTDFSALLDKLKSGVGVSASDVPTGLTQELLDSIMKQSPEMTPEQRNVINRQADEAMAKAMSALSARGIGAGSDAAIAIVQGEFQRQSMIAAEQARIRSENTANALQAAGLSIESLKNAQGYSMQQRLATLAETTGIADIVQKQQDAAARANEFAKTFGLDQAKFSEAVRQYNSTFGLDTAKFEEVKKQFADTFGLDTARYNEAVKEFEAQFGLETEKFQEAKNQFEKEYGLKVDDQAFMQALQTGQLNLEAIKIDDARRLQEIQIANDFIAKSNDTDLQAKLGFSKLELERMIAGEEIDLAKIQQGIDKWAKQMGFDIETTKLQMELAALQASNKEDFLDVISGFALLAVKFATLGGNKT